MGGWVYILTKRPHGTLYIGVTNDLARRMWEHRNNMSGSFTSWYALHRLVHMEFHDDIQLAIQREKSLKKWPRVWKLDLIERDNPHWEDLYERLLS